MNRDLFILDLQKVFKKHRVWLSGVVKIRDLKKFDEATASCLIREENGLYPYKDVSGPFLGFYINPIEEEVKFDSKKVKTVIMDKDKLLANGVVSPLDQKSSFTNRQSWGEHLKANGCVEYGNDLNNHKAPTEVRGDFDCRKELTEATHQVMGKHGH